MLILFLRHTFLKNLIVLGSIKQNFITDRFFVTCDLAASEICAGRSEGVRAQKMLDCL